MGITIRELVTKFGFEVDEKGAKKIEGRIGSMKSGIGSLGKLLGVSLGVAGARAFWQMGQSADRAAWNLERIAGIEGLGELKKKFSGIKEEIDGIKAGSSNVFTAKDFDVAAAGFLKVFGRGKGQIETFGKLFSFAAKQSAITGVNVNDIMEQLQSGIQGGGFDALLELPGFDIFKKQMLEFQQAAIDPGDPGGRIALQNRLKAIMNIVADASTDQNKDLKKVPEVLLEADKAAATFQDGLQKLAKTANDVLIPALKGINDGLTRFNELIEVARNAKTPQGAFRDVMSEIFNPKEKPQAVVPIAGPVPQSFPTSQKNGKVEISIQNTFHVAAGDAFSVARVVKQAQAQQLKETMDSLVKTEE